MTVLSPGLSLRANTPPVCIGMHMHDCDSTQRHHKGQESYKESFLKLLYNFQEKHM